MVSGQVEGTPYAGATGFGSASETRTFSLGASTVERTSCPESPLGPL